MNEQLFLETPRDRQLVAETDRFYQGIQREHGDCTMCNDGTPALVVHPTAGAVCGGHWLVVKRHEAL